jgi:LysM repeat protein
MGSVRRTTWRQYLAYIAMNIVVSALTVIVVLALWDRRAPAASPTPSPTVDIAARVASAKPTTTPTIAPTATPVTYTVQEGDSLYTIALDLGIALEDLMDANGLTDPNRLEIGQELIVPQPGDGSGGPTATPKPSPIPPTVTPNSQPEAPRVEIRGVDGAGTLETETIRLLNAGGVAAMAGWTLEDDQGNVYVFPAFTLHNGAVSVHTRGGTDTVIDLYWGLGKPVLLPGKVITLRDAAGAVQSTFTIPE